MIGALLTFAMLSSTAASRPLEQAHRVPWNTPGFPAESFDLTNRET